MVDCRDRSIMEIDCQRENRILPLKDFAEFLHFDVKSEEKVEKRGERNAKEVYQD